MRGPTVVVGAGAAGLAVAAELARRGAEHRVLEAAPSVGTSWRGRYDGLRLHTVRWLSGLPGAPIPRRYGRWVRRDDLVAYLEDYAARAGVEPTFGVRVEGLARTATGWRLDTSAGPEEARSVVLATGFSRVPNLPRWPGQESFPGTVLHSSAYREPSPYRDRRVLVVGAGNSAAEIALELADGAAEVWVSVRRPPNIVRRTTLGVPSQLLSVALRKAPPGVMNRLLGILRRLSVPDLTAAGLPAPPGDAFGQFLRSQTVPILDHGFVDAVRAGGISVVAEVERFDAEEVRLVDGRALRPDVVLTATGYRPGLEGLVGDLGVLDERGVPVVHGPRTAPQAPGLYFVGINVTLAGLLRDIGLEARAVARAVSDPR